MSDSTPDELARRAAALGRRQRPADPQGRDRGSRARALRRVVDAGAAFAAPAAALRPRRADRLVGLGALSLVLREPRLGGPRPQPAQPLLVADRRTSTTTDFDAYVDDVVSVMEKLGPEHGDRSATAWAGCWCSRPRSVTRSGAVVLLDSELPRDLRSPVRPHELREIPDVYGRDHIGWETLPGEAPARQPRPHDRGRHPAPAPVRAEAARVGAGQARDPARASPIDRARLAGVPILVVGAGLDGTSSATGAERLADWLGGDLRAVRSPFALRPGHRRAELPAGRGWRPGVPGDAPPVGRGAAEDGAATDGAHPRSCYHPARPASRRPTRCRIRLEAQDTALSRLRSSVRIRYAVPTRRYPNAPGPRPGGVSYAAVPGALATRPTCRSEASDLRFARPAASGSNRRRPAVASQGSTGRRMGVLSGRPRVRESQETPWPSIHQRPPDPAGHSAPGADRRLRPLGGRARHVAARLSPAAAAAARS